MGQTLGYSLGTDTPEGRVVSAPDDFAMISGTGSGGAAPGAETNEHPRPVFTAIPVPTPAPAVTPVPAMRPLPRGVQADISVRRSLARRIGEDIHSNLFGVSALKETGATGKLSLNDYEYSVFQGETQGPELRKEFVAMIINELSKSSSTTLKPNEEILLAEAPTEELVHYPIKIRGPAAYLKYRWRRGWDNKAFYVIVAFEKEYPVKIASEAKI